jgi:hypothetical protein
MGEDKIRKGREQNSQQGKSVEKKSGKGILDMEEEWKRTGLFRATRSKRRY